MSNIKVESIGYCVIRRAERINPGKIINTINGVFGVFDTLEEAEDFISNLSPLPVVLNKRTDSYLDGGHYFTIKHINKPAHDKKIGIVRSRSYKGYKAWYRAMYTLNPARQAYEGGGIEKFYDKNDRVIAEWNSAKDIGFLFLEEYV